MWANDLQQGIQEQSAKNEDPLQRIVLARPGIHVQRVKLDPYFVPHTKINLKWTKDLDVRSKTTKFPKEGREKAS